MNKQHISDRIELNLLISNEPNITAYFVLKLNIINKKHLRK